MCKCVGFATIKADSTPNLDIYRLVPALNVIATHFNIPPDIAGATLMAAGASSPELCSSIVSLFITHSSLGLGTIVGSEIFNQLIIVAGAVYASPNGVLALDKAIVTREVGFYALGIALLYYALRDSEVDPDDPDGPEHIYISFLDAALLFCGYLLYVVVCANMDRIVQWFGGSEEKEEMKSLGAAGYGSIAEEESNVTKMVSFLT
jgi:Ca2+/Na+ antiporter